ncbi:hypothetical protein D3C73_1620900 [compost metagenome]
MWFTDAGGQQVFGVHSQGHDFQHHVGEVDHQFVVFVGQFVAVMRQVEDIVYER